MVYSPGVRPPGTLILPSASIVAPVPLSSVIVIVTLSVVAGILLILSLVNTSIVPPVPGIVLSPSEFTSIVEGTTTLIVPD